MASFIDFGRAEYCDGGFGGWGRERPVKQRVTRLGNGAGGGQHGAGN